MELQPTILGKQPMNGGGHPIIKSIISLPFGGGFNPTIFFSWGWFRFRIYRILGMIQLKNKIRPTNMHLWDGNQTWRWLKIHDRGTLFYCQLGRNIQLIIDHSNSFFNVGCSVLLEFKPLCPNQKNYLVLAWEIRMPYRQHGGFGQTALRDVLPTAFSPWLLFCKISKFTWRHNATHTQTQFLRLLQSPKG